MACICSGRAGSPSWCRAQLAQEWTLGLDLAKAGIRSGGIIPFMDRAAAADLQRPKALASAKAASMAMMDGPSISAYQRLPAPTFLSAHMFLYMYRPVQFRSSLTIGLGTIGHRQASLRQDEQAGHQAGGPPGKHLHMQGSSVIRTRCP